MVECPFLKKSEKFSETHWNLQGCDMWGSVVPGFEDKA